MRRAQLAIEFLTVMAFATVLLVGYLTTALVLQHRAQDTAGQEAAEAVAARLQTEIILATQVHDGYARAFFLPETLSSRSYTITATSGLVSVDAGPATASRRTPPFNGTPTPGQNTISRRGTEVWFS